MLVFKNGPVGPYAIFALKTRPIRYAGLVKILMILFFTNMTAFCVIQIAIREAGGIDLILLASKNHVANVNIQYAVCGVLRNLSIAASNRVSL